MLVLEDIMPNESPTRTNKLFHWK